MTNKISITIDVSRIKKSRITDRTFDKKDGTTVNKKEYKLDIVPLAEPKLIKEGDGWKMMKTHFVCESATKEERAAKTKTEIIGDGITFIETESKDADTIEFPEGDTPTGDDDFPF